MWTKAIANSPVKMIKLAVDFDDVSALTLYDVLHDPTFRSVWDESMIEGSGFSLFKTYLNCETFKLSKTASLFQDWTFIKSMISMISVTIPYDVLHR